MKKGQKDQRKDKACVVFKNADTASAKLMSPDTVLHWPCVARL